MSVVAIVWARARLLAKRLPRLRSHGVARNPARLHAAPVFARLRAMDIGVQVHDIPIHLQPFRQVKGFKSGDFQHAEAWYRSALSLPLFPPRREAQQDEVVSALKTTLR